MKKIYLYLTVALATFAIIISCSKEQGTPVLEESTDAEEVIIPEEGVDGLITLTFTAEYPTPIETKTTVTEEGVVAWEKDDQITLYYLEDGQPKSVNATALASGSRVQFSATLPSGTDYIYAAYPAGTGNLTEEGVFAINTSATPNGVFSDVNYAAAYTPIEDPSNAHLKFTNVTGLFRIPLPEGGVITDNNSNTYTIASVTVGGKSSEPAFLGAVTVTQDNGVLSFSEPSEPLTTTTVTLTDAARNQGYVYVPSLPVTAADGLVFRFTDIDGKAIPAAVSKDGQTVVLERGHIKPAPAVDGIVWDWYFAEKGTGDGKTEASPAGLGEFQTLVNATSAVYGQWRLNGATLHLADGAYTLTEQLNIQGDETGTIRITGASGKGTIVDGTTIGSENKQIFNMNSAMDMTLENLTVQNGVTNLNGPAFMYCEGAAGNLEFNNCSFLNNTNSAAAGGAVYLKGSGNVTLKGCQFEGNSAKGSGGALSVSSVIHVEMSNCTFYNNSTGKNGGAIYVGVTNADVRIDDSSFLNNKCTIDKTKGGAIYLENKPVLFVNRTVFDSNSLSHVSSGGYGPAINAGSGYLGLNNCTFHYNHGNSTGKSTVLIASNYIIANCTFLESLKYNPAIISSRATGDGLATLINNIIVNNVTEDCYSLDNYNNCNYLTSGYNVITSVDSGFTAFGVGTGNYVGTDAKSKTIGNDAAMTDNQYYAWDGDVTDIDGYSKCTYSDIQSMITGNTALGNAFWTWLKTLSVVYDGTAYDATQVDIRGVPRGESALWPGSYQQD